MTARVCIPFSLALLILFTASLSALSPENDFWDTAIERMSGEGRLPEDSRMGLLADSRRPGDEWAAAITVCDVAFRSIRSGIVPEETVLERMRPLLIREFETVLANGGLEVYPRYGLPLREGRRVSVPVRLASESGAVYGYVYLVRTDEGSWFIDQWALDLTGMKSLGKIEPESD